MKITEVNTYFVRPRWGFVEIITDDGLTGWGEAVLEGHAAAVLSCVQEYKDYLIGQDPSRIEDIWSTIYRAGFYRGGGVLMSALSGIDQALGISRGNSSARRSAPFWAASAVTGSRFTPGSAETVPVTWAPQRWKRSARAFPPSR